MCSLLGANWPASNSYTCQDMALVLATGAAEEMWELKYHLYNHFHIFTQTHTHAHTTWIFTQNSHRAQQSRQQDQGSKHLKFKQISRQTGCNMVTSQEWVDFKIQDQITYNKNDSQHSHNIPIICVLDFIYPASIIKSIIMCLSSYWCHPNLHRAYHNK